MNENDIKIWNYGNYSSDNYGSSRAVRIGKLTLYFSYNTIVAFEDGHKLYVCENVFSTTTGRHLNCIDGGNKKNRLPYEEFKQKLEETLKKYKLIECNEDKTTILEQYQCQTCGRFWYINKDDKSYLDMQYGCPYGCDDAGKHTRTITIRIEETKEVR